MSHYVICLEVCLGCGCSFIRACLWQFEKTVKSDGTQASTYLKSGLNMHKRSLLRFLDSKRVKDLSARHVPSGEMRLAGSLCVSMCL